jgi:hypothetical protein
MEQGADRGGGDHRRRQPAVEGHDRRLADSEDKENQQAAGDQGRGVGRENPPGDKVEGPGGVPGADNRQEEKEDRGGEQHSEVDPAPLLGLLGPGMGDQGVGGEGQHLIENEQGEEVVGVGDPHHRGDGNGEAGVEAGLVVFIVAAHVADGVDGGHQPEVAGNEGEEQPQRLDGEIQGQTGKEFRPVQPNGAAGSDDPVEAADQIDQDQTGGDRHPLAEVGE